MPVVRVKSVMFQLMSAQPNTSCPSGVSHSFASHMKFDRDEVRSLGVI